MKVSDLKGEVRVIGSPQNSQVPQAQQSSTEKKSAFTGFSTGVAKGELSTLRGLGTIGQSVLDQTAGRVVNAVQGKGFTPTTGGIGDIYRPSTTLGQKTIETLKPKGTAENIGFGVEQSAEYLIPAFKASKAERAIDVLSKGISSPTAAAAYRVAVKGGIQGASAAAVKLAQTGGDLKESAKTGLIAGGTRAALGTVGEVARAVKLPERFYQMIFKNAKLDMNSELNANGLANLKQTKPEVYAKLVESGVVKERTVPGAVDIANTINRHEFEAKQILDTLPDAQLNANGGPGKVIERLKTNIVDALSAEGRTEASAAISKLNPAEYQTVDAFTDAAKAVSTKISPTINKTVAEQALERGLKGSINTMANEVVGKKYETEYAVQKLVDAYKKPIAITEPQYENVLRQVALEYKDVGFNEISDEAQLLADTIKKTDGQVPAKAALQIRRFLDKLRFATSYDKPPTSMSLTQSNLKTLSDALRTRINAIPGMGSLMNDYSFYIDALADLSREAAQRGNSQVVSLIDSIFLGGSIGGSNPVGFATAGIGRKLLQSGAGSTLIGSALKNSVASPATGAAIGATAGAIAPVLGDQQSKTKIGQ